jgi:hypothetical protein
LALSFWCEPMAHVTGFWTVPGASEDSVVDYLKTHTPRGLTFEEATGSNATGEAHIEADLIEYSATKNAQNGLVYEVVPRTSDVVIRADSFEIPSNATCATAPPGTALGYWGG